MMLKPGDSEELQLVKYLHVHHFLSLLLLDVKQGNRLLPIYIVFVLTQMGIKPKSTVSVQ